MSSSASCVANQSYIKCGETYIKNISKLNGSYAFVPAFEANTVNSMPNCVINSTEAICLEYPSYETLNIKKTIPFYTTKLMFDPDDKLYTLNINPKISRDNLVFKNTKEYSQEEKDIQNEGDAPYCIVDINKCTTLRDGCDSICVSQKDNSILRRIYNSSDYYEYKN